MHALSITLNDQFPIVRASAAVSLGQIGAEAQEALSPLAKIASKSAKFNDEERYARFTAAEAVVKIVEALTGNDEEMFAASRER